MFGRESLLSKTGKLVLVGCVAFMALQSIDSKAAEPENTENIVYSATDDESRVISDTASVSDTAYYPVALVDGRRNNGGGNGSDGTSIDVTATFESAAYVKFNHDKFVVPVMDETFLNNVHLVKATDVTVHGAPGEVAQMTCRIEQLEKTVVETYKAVKSTDCQSGGQVRKVMTGNKAKSSVEFNGNMKLLRNTNSYVSLEISYL